MFSPFIDIIITIYGTACIAFILVIMGAIITTIIKPANPAPIAAPAGAPREALIIAPELLSGTTLALKTYIEGFNDKIPYSHQLEDLGIESNKPEHCDFCCPISLDIMNKPVLINGTSYDYASIATLRIDPQSRDTFSRNQIQPDRRSNQNIQTLISKYRAEYRDPALAALAPAAPPAEILQLQAWARDVRSRPR